MLTEIFVTNSKGHLIFRETGVYTKESAQQNYRQFHDVLRSDPESPPYFCHKDTHFYHTASDGLHWVAVSAAPLSSLQVVVWLQTLRDVVRAICGGAAESALRANHVALRELAAEIMEDGLMMSLDAGRLRALLMSRPNVSLATDLRSPSSPSQPVPAAGAKHTVYVDVVESVDCVMTPEGELERCEVSGRLEVRTAGPGCSRVDVALAEDVRLLEQDAPVEAHLGPQVHVRRLHPSGRRQARWLSGPSGELTLLEYAAAGRPPPPLAVRLSAARLPASADLQLLLRLRLLVPAELRAPSLSLQFRPPAATGGVSAACSGAGRGQVRHCRQTALVTWTVRELSGQQEATAQLRLADADAGGATETVGPFHLSWEISDHTVSGLRVSGVRLPGVPESETRRWVRHAAVSAVHLVQPVTVT